MVTKLATPTDGCAPKRTLPIVDRAAQSLYYDHGSNLRGFSELQREKSEQTPDDN